MRRALLIAAFGVAALASPSVASAANPRLVAVVGPGFTISLTTEAGQPVTQLDPGTYDITVRDAAEAHSFHLSGPGVDRRTAVEFVGTEEWTVTFAAGTYRFVCGAHPSSMRGTFTVGAAPPPPPPPSGAPPVTLSATVGPGFTIALLRAAKRVVALKAGAYVVRVRDRSAGHNFRLSGPGVNRATGVGFAGTQTWRVTLRRGTYRFLCDVHPRQMRGTIRVS